jgi:serine phosphatase RsbU (regulator of sigma subunit)
MDLEDIAGKAIFDVFPDDPASPGQARDLRKVITGAIDLGVTQRLVEYPYDIPNKLGGFDRRLWNVIEVPIADEHGRTELVVHYTEDVTELVDARSARELADSISLGLQERVDQVQGDLRDRALELERVNRQLAEALAHDRSIAETLQAALLTELPEVDGLGFLADYRPAADQVGGDWYDVLDLEDSTTVVIGDVVGHDTRAAAAMGQLKSMLRVLAWKDDSSPGAVLDRLDRALVGLHVDTVASALVARLDRGDDGSSTMTWSSAGHPPPLLVHPDGRVEVLAMEPGVLVGVHHDEARRDTTTTLVPGAMVVLYTDGLVERRDQPLDRGIDRLAETLAQCLRDGVAREHLTETVIDRMVGVAAEDDIAVLVVENPA